MPFSPTFRIVKLSDGRTSSAVLVQATVMTKIGPDSNYHDLVYYEFSEVQASAFLTKLGLSP